MEKWKIKTERQNSEVKNENGKVKNKNEITKWPPWVKNENGKVKNKNGISTEKQKGEVKIKTLKTKPKK